MGAAQSSQTGQEHVISAPEPSTSVSVSCERCERIANGHCRVVSPVLTCRPIQFSPSLVDRLSHPPSEKPKSTDEVVRQRLAAEAAHIRQQEAEILEKISAALEKENLDKEKPGMSSEVLGRDIEESDGPRRVW
jgi:altered-inheritance-of-mitochondria protein 13